ncbi:MAG: histidine kinase dimerization/phospho-acceptor domain-containing protein [Pyrinomonadaceae bacterium]
MTHKKPLAEQIDVRDAEQLMRQLRDYECAFVQTRELTGRIRHDLNNALTGMLGQTQLLLREDLSAGARGRVEVIESLTVRVKELIALLRDLPPPVKP